MDALLEWGEFVHRHKKLSDHRDVLGQAVSAKLKGTLTAEQRSDLEELAGKLVN